jgi:hypothetical protein
VSAQPDQGTAHVAPTENEAAQSDVERKEGSSQQQQGAPCVACAIERWQIVLEGAGRL